MKVIERGWVIIGLHPRIKGKFVIVPGTFSYTKKEAIRAFLNGDEVTWEVCRKRYGWNVKRATKTFEIDQ
jgi:hypothetical protein